MELRLPNRFTLFGFPRYPIPLAPFRQRMLPTVVWLTICPMLIAAEMVSAGPYLFTRIADSTSLAINESFQSLDLNSHGSVAYTTGTNIGTRKLILFDGTSSTTITTNNIGLGVAIDDLGRVAWYEGSALPSERAVRRSDGTVLRQLLTGEFFNPTPIALNSVGNAAFVIDSHTGSLRSIYRSDGGSVDVISTGNLTTDVRYLGIDDMGRVAYSIGDTFIEITDGIQSWLILDASVTNSNGFDMSDNGLIVYSESSTTDGLRVFDVNNDSNVLLGTFGFFPEINNEGDVAFHASTGGGLFGIHVLSSGSTDLVIKEGDPLDGSTITNLYRSRSDTMELNNSGQIAFMANLADGRTGIYLATPIPEVSVIGLTAASGCVILFIGWRSRTRDQWGFGLS